MAEAAMGSGPPVPSDPRKKRTTASRIKDAVLTFGKFIGPGFMIAVAYIDPGNYSTDVAAGASYQYKLLFIVLISNLFAIFLQSLSIKLGTVTGLNLAEACRAFLPRWLNWALYILAEIAIIATDMAEVIGTAIALNLLNPGIPLVAGCALSVLDVMIILLFYRPGGSMRGLRAFELLIVMIVLAVVVCFCVQLSLIKDTYVGDVFRGYLPSHAIVEQQGLYQACGILGATVMPHSLYLGSGIVQSRLRDYDQKSGHLPRLQQSEAGNKEENNDKTSPAPYIPSLAAIRHSLKYSIAELALSLFTFALFINSAILIVAGASLYGNPEVQDADIFGVHDLLSKSLGGGAGTVFALSLLLSGISAGIVCTIAGQMISEGALNWSMPPWLRRLVTRSISITPSIIIAGAVGKDGLDTALNASQVVLSVVLPFITAPLIYFTCRNRYMTVEPDVAREQASMSRPRHETSETTAQHDREQQSSERTAQAADGDVSGNPQSEGGRVVAMAEAPEEAPVKMANSIPVAVVAVVIWLIITALNIANIVLLAKGASG